MRRAFAGVGLETPDGWLAAAGMEGRLRLGYRDQSGQPAVDLVGHRGGPLQRLVADLNRHYRQSAGLQRLFLHAHHLALPARGLSLDCPPEY